jgi:hypothetical protein
MDVFYIIVSVAKGGVMKVFKHDALLYSFTGFIGKTAAGEVLATQLYGSIVDSTIDDDMIVIKGKFQKVFFKLQTTDKFFALRSIMLTLGRSWKIGSFIKHILVKKLITKKKVLDKEYSITVEFDKNSIFFKAIIDEGQYPCVEMYETTDLALIQVPTSRYYQEVNLKGWKKITPQKTIIRQIS